MYQLTVSRYSVMQNGRSIGVIIPVDGGWQFVSRSFPYFYAPGTTPGLALSHFLDRKEA